MYTGIDQNLLKEYYQKGYWSHRTLLDCWDDAVCQYSSKTYVLDDCGHRKSYAQIDAEADAVAAYLQKHGICQGDVVSFQITPRCEFAAVLFGCIKLGAIPAPLGMCFAGDELCQLLKKLHSRLHFCVCFYRHRDIRERSLALRQVLGPDFPLVFVGGSCPGQDHLDQILSQSAVPAVRSTADADDIALILCTSGTTQGSKAVLYTHNAILASESSFNKAYSLTEQDVMFMPAPLNHATGLHHGLISPMLVGGTVVLQEIFQCHAAVELMNRERCTYSMGATPFIYDILNSLAETNDRLPWLRFYICGGAPVSQELVQRAYQQYGLLVCECYGSSESVPHVGVRPEECLANNGTSAGRPMEGIEVRIVDREHHPLPAGQIGEEASRGPNLFAGYLEAPQLTAQAIDEDGWFYSGDLAVMDERGCIRIVGRIKDIIIRGGENLNSNDIDCRLEGCPGVLDHAVIGMPDPRLGERICAFVVCEPGKSVDKDQLVHYLKHKQVQKRLWPERVEQIDQIPRTESGKVRKNLLCDELERRMKGEVSL